MWNLLWSRALYRPRNLVGRLAGRLFGREHPYLFPSLISYPRTASRLLTRDVYDTLPAVMEKILSRKEFRQYAKMTDFAAPPNDISAQETTDHHTIIVTGMPPGTLNKEEQLVYTLILGRTLEAFMPSCRVEYTTIDVVCAARKFSVQTYRVLKKGWLSIFGREHLIARGGMPCSALPDFSPGEPVPVSGCNIVRKRTLPVSPYTDEELVGYMDRSGLGTVSTRTNIIRTLLERKYIRYSGKYVIPTPKGLFFYETVRGMKVADTSLTSGWEAELARIEQGKLTQEEFLGGVLEQVKEVTGEIFRIYQAKNNP